MLVYGSKMFQPRPLRRFTFPDRISSYGIPLAWLVVFVQQTAPFLSAELGFALGAVYIVCVAWHGLFRELSVPFVVYGATGKKSFAARWRARFARLANTISDAACAACFLFFLRGYEALPAAFFAPLFILAVAAHVATETEVQRLLNQLRNNSTFDNRAVPDEERKVLVSLEKITFKQPI